MSAEREYPPIVYQRRRWSDRYLQAGAGWPLFGSPEWCALPADDPRRVAACVAAAEVYTRDRFDDLEEWLRAEVEALRAGHKRAEDLEYLRSFAGHIKRNGGRVLTSFEERRRRQVEAAKPRPGDHPGGPGKPWKIGGNV